MSRAAPIGVVLLNLGGPASQDDVGAFIRSLLADPEVMPLPWPLRPLLAKRIARRRAPLVAGHYRAIGGKSPLAEQTRAQVQALSAQLGPAFRVRYAFRHSEPRTDLVLQELAGEGVRRIVALPAYPQRSGSTTGSALRDLRQAARALDLRVCEVPSFPQGGGFIQALSELTLPLLNGSAHVILSAHGLPLRIVRKGDPYVDEVRQTEAALGARLPKGTGWTLAFQSRMGRTEWTRPYLIDEIQRLGAEGVRALVVVPLTFACENFETLYELDIQMAELARESGIPAYRRAPAPGCHPAFITGLADLTRQATREAGWEVPHA